MKNQWESPQADAEYAETLTAEAKELRGELDVLLAEKEKQLAPLRERVTSLSNALNRGKTLKQYSLGPMDEEERTEVEAEIEAKTDAYKEIENRLDNEPRMRELLERLYEIKSDRGGQLQHLSIFQDLPKYPEPHN